MSKSIPNYKRDNQWNKSFALIGPSLNATNVELLGISPMNAGNPKLRTKEMLVMALTTKENTMIFSDTMRKLLFLKRRTRAAAGEDSDEEEFINMALMATSEEQEDSSACSQILTSILSDLSKEECKSCC